MSLIPELMGKFDVLQRRGYDQIKVLENYLYMLSQRADIEEQYSKSMAKVNTYFSYNLDVEDKTKQSIFNNVQNDNNFHADSSLVLAAALQAEIIIFKETLQIHYQNIKKYQDDMKSSQKDLRNNFQQMEKFKEKYFKVSKDFEDIAIYQQLLETNPETASEQLLKNQNQLKEISQEKIDCQTQFKVQTKTYNNNLQFFIDNCSQLNELILKDELLRQNVLQEFTLKFFSLEINASLQNHQETSGNKQNISPLETQNLDIVPNQIAFVKDYSYTLQKLHFFSSFLHQNAEQIALNNDALQLNQILNQESNELEANPVQLEIKDDFLQFSRSIIEFYTNIQQEEQKKIQQLIDQEQKVEVKISQKEPTQENKTNSETNSDSKNNNPEIKNEVSTQNKELGQKQEESVEVNEQINNNIQNQENQSEISQDTQNVQNQIHNSQSHQVENPKNQVSENDQKTQVIENKIIQNQNEVKLNQTKVQEEKQQVVERKLEVQNQIPEIVEVQQIEYNMDQINAQIWTIAKQKLLEFIEQKNEKILNLFPDETIENVQFLINFIATSGGPSQKISSSTESLNRFYGLITRFFYRDLSIFIMQSFRLERKFEFSDIELYNMSEIILSVLDLCFAQHDSNNIKKIMLIAFSLYTQKNDQRHFLYELIKKHKVWSNLNLWEAIIVSSIGEDISKQIQQIQGSLNDRLLQHKNLIHSNLLSISLNMVQFNVTKGDIKMIISQYGEQYGLFDIQIQELHNFVDINIDPGSGKQLGPSAFSLLNLIYSNTSNNTEQVTSSVNSSNTNSASQSPAQPQQKFFFF